MKTVGSQSLLFYFFPRAFPDRSRFLEAYIWREGKVSYCIMCIMRYINLIAIYPWAISIISAANEGDKCCFRFEGSLDKRERAITASMIGKDYRVINGFNNKFILSRIAPALDNKTKHFSADPYSLFRAIFMTGSEMRIEKHNNFLFTINFSFNQHRIVSFKVHVIIRKYILQFWKHYFSRICASSQKYKFR